MNGISFALADSILGSFHFLVQTVLTLSFFKATKVCEQHVSIRGVARLSLISLFQTSSMASIEPQKRPASAAETPRSEPPSKKRLEASECVSSCHVLKTRLTRSGTHYLSSLQSSLDKSVNASACIRTFSAPKATSSPDASLRARQSQRANKLSCSTTDQRHSV